MFQADPRPLGLKTRRAVVSVGPRLRSRCAFPPTTPGTPSYVGQVGALFGVTHHVDWYAPIPLFKPCGLSGASPHQLRAVPQSRNAYVFKKFSSNCLPSAV